MTDAALGAIVSSDSDELESPARRALRRLFQRKGAVVGLVVIGTFFLLAVFAPLIAPYDPIATSWTLVRKAPSAQHWFGTDDLGRDILVRVIYGALAHRAVPHPAQHHAGAAGAGDIVDRGRHHRRGGAVVPRARPAAARAVLGQHAERRPALPDQRAMDGAVAGAGDLP